MKLKFLDEKFDFIQHIFASSNTFFSFFSNSAFGQTCPTFHPTSKIIVIIKLVEINLNIFNALANVIYETYESDIPCHMNCALIFAMFSSPFKSLSQPNEITGGVGALSLNKMTPQVFVFPGKKRIIP